MVRKVSDSPYGVAVQTESVLLLALRKIRGGRDPKRITAEDMSGRTHAIENSPDSDKQSAEGLRRGPRRI
jgi:hypothetical protein